MHCLQGTDEQIREEITALFNDHVKEVNAIYTATTFPYEGQIFSNHGFRVTRVEVSLIHI